MKPTGNPVALGTRTVVGRVGAGFTYLARRHITDAVKSGPTTVLNTGLGARYGTVELGVDAYNLLGLTYADDESAYVSNLNVQPGRQPASFARHLTAAPPRTVIGTLTLYL